MGIDVPVIYCSERAHAPPHRSRYAAECLRIILALEQVHTGSRKYEYKGCKHKAKKEFFFAVGNRLREVTHRQRELAERSEAKDSQETKETQQHKIGSSLTHVGKASSSLPAIR